MSMLLLLVAAAAIFKYTRACLPEFFVFTRLRDYELVVEWIAMMFSFAHGL